MTDKPFKGGYQIGVDNDLLQGMLGGALLNMHGELVAILGKGKVTILDDNAYEYDDGTQPTKELKTQFSDSSFSIPVSQLTQITP